MGIESYPIIFILLLFPLFTINEDLKYEYSLIQPFTEITFNDWNFVGTGSVESSSAILTKDFKNQKGGLWLTRPILIRNWKVIIDFRVSGSATHLYGDGFAFWYVKDHSSIGPVFGSKDYFKGLGVMFDTYSNHKDVHKHLHPYISAQVNDGKASYDHDSDGTHSQIGGCSNLFRGKKYSKVEITYLGSLHTLKIRTVAGSNENENFKSCFMSEKVFLPTQYYFGFSALTGDLSDTHEILGFKVYDLDKEYSYSKDDDPSRIVPYAEKAEKPRIHLDGPKASTNAWRFFKRVLVFFFVLVFTGLTLIAIFSYLNKRQREKMKRLY